MCYLILACVLRFVVGISLFSEDCDMVNNQERHGERLEVSWQGLA